jgi:hypothetical protein
MEMSDQIGALAALLPDKHPQLVWLQILSGRYGIEKNFFFLPGIEPRPSGPQLISIPAEI